MTFRTGPVHRAIILTVQQNARSERVHVRFLLLHLGLDSLPSNMT